MKKFKFNVFNTGFKLVNLTKTVKRRKIMHWAIKQKKFYDGGISG